MLEDPVFFREVSRDYMVPSLGVVGAGYHFILGVNNKSRYESNQITTYISVDMDTGRAEHRANHDFLFRQP
jgi:hypothetical protein